MTTKRMILGGLALVIAGAAAAPAFADDRGVPPGLAKKGVSEREWRAFKDGGREGSRDGDRRQDGRYDRDRRGALEEWRVRGDRDRRLDGDRRGERQDWQVYNDDDLPIGGGAYGGDRNLDRRWGG
ncbi:MAG: hypothetical protein VYD87_14665 [Pseudomonadota bacterium]|nr:hypothetical protein [Pseudomonadota bacterium]